MEEKILTIKKSIVWKVVIILFAILLVAALFTRGFGLVGKTIDNGEFAGFDITGDSICKDSDGKPYVILFSTTWCPHCEWIKDTFDSLANEDFADRINLQHWELDIGDNTITPETETEVPAEISALFQKYNPKNSIPTFVFGCSYTRIGNAHEQEQDLNAELEDFRTVINKLLE